MVMGRSSSLNVAHEMGAYGLPPRKTEEECIGGGPFSLQKFSNYGAQAERCGLNIGDSFERKCSGWKTQW